MEHLEHLEYSTFTPSELYYILSIDVGVKNLGISLSSCTFEFVFVELIWFETVDITRFGHKTKQEERNCQIRHGLHHQKTYADYVSHLISNYQGAFDECDIILIERQPPGGYVMVEQLIFSEFRYKSVLIHPLSVHKFFGWTTMKYTYDERKVKSAQVMMYILRSGDREYLKDKYECKHRKHDASDTVCFLLYWLDRRAHRHKLECLRTQSKGTSDMLDQFKLNF